MYTDEYEGVFPGYVQDTWIGQGDSTPIWVGMVQPYMKSREVHLCPSAPGSMFGTTWGTRSRLSIGLNINYGLWIYGGRPLRAVASDMEELPPTWNTRVGPFSSVTVLREISVPAIAATSRRRGTTPSGLAASRWSSTGRWQR